MKAYIIIISALVVGFNTYAQNNRAEAWKFKGASLFVKALPEAEYDIVDEVKITGVGKSSKEAIKLQGAIGYNQISEGIDKFNEIIKKAEKKGKKIEYDGIIVVKPKLITFIKLKGDVQGAGPTGVGAVMVAQKEKKTGKMVFYASKPYEDYEVISRINYNSSGLGETMRGLNGLDVPINGMLDKGMRWVKKGKISSDFDALLISWSAIRSGRIEGELIKFK